MDIERVRDAETPAEMRAEIYRLQHHNYFVRAATDAANFAGMSGEDRYTMLAYNALRRLECVEADLREFILRMPPKPVVLKTEGTPNA